MMNDDQNSHGKCSCCETNKVQSLKLKYEFSISITVVCIVVIIMNLTNMFYLHSQVMKMREQIHLQLEQKPLTKQPKLSEENTLNPAV